MEGIFDNLAQPVDYRLLEVHRVLEGLAEQAQVISTTDGTRVTERSLLTQACKQVKEDATQTAKAAATAVRNAPNRQQKLPLL